MARREELKFSSADKAALVPKLTAYLSKELDVDVGQFDAEFLLDFFVKEAGAVLYNRGLKDAHAALAKHIDDFGEVIYALEQDTDAGRS